MPPATLRAAPRDDDLQVRFGRIGDQVTICPFIIEDGRIMSEQSSELTPAEGVVESLQIRTRRGTFRFEQALDQAEFEFLQRCKVAGRETQSLVEDECAIHAKIAEWEDVRRAFDASLAGITGDGAHAARVRQVLLALLRDLYQHELIPDTEFQHLRKQIRRSPGGKETLLALAKPAILGKIGPVIHRLKEVEGEEQEKLMLLAIMNQLLPVRREELAAECTRLASYSSLQSHSQKFLQEQERLLRRDNQHRILETNPELAKLPIYLWGAYDPTFADILGAVPIGA